VYLKLADDGTLTLEETDDFKRFHIAADPDKLSEAGFQGMAEDAGDGHYWLDADAVAKLSGRSGDAEWMAGFWAMLEKAAPYGYADLEGRRIKAHLA